MVTFLRNGIGEAANGGFIPKGLPGYYSDGIHIILKKPKQL